MLLTLFGSQAVALGQIDAYLVAANKLDNLASTPVGRRSSPGSVGPDAPQPSGAGRHNPQHVNGPGQAVQNAPGTVNGRDFSGHAFDQMRNRGLTPSVVENAIQTGSRSAGGTPGTSMIHDAVNNVTVIVNDAGGVVTVY
ncbi:MAG: DUF4258 domain-containing protein [Verrucomicrobiota bacterium]